MPSLNRQNKSKQKQCKHKYICCFFFLLRDAGASASSTLQCQVEKHVHKWDAIFTPLDSKWFGHNLVPRVSLLPLWRRRKEGREMLGTRLIWSDIRQTRACASFCFRVHYFDASKGTGIKRKKKCPWPCACIYTYVGSFSRHVLSYLYLCSRPCLCN